MNMYNRDQAQQYLRQQIESSTPAQQLVLLYDGIIKFTLQAQDAIIRGDIQGRYNANRRAMEIVNYLMEILDTEKGGEVAQRLQRIYMYLLKQCLDVDFKNNPAICDDILQHVRTLRASWDQLAKQGAVAGQGQPVQAAPTGAQVVASPAGSPTLPPGRRNAVA